MNTSTSPKVQYSFENGSDNTIRITGMTYPDGRNVVDDYGTTGGINDASSRIFGMKNSGVGTNLVEYQYLEVYAQKGVSHGMCKSPAVDRPRNRVSGRTLRNQDAGLRLSQRGFLESHTTADGRQRRGRAGNEYPC